ncbi:MAG: DUF4330 domain-containing protein [Bacillota bacterium]|jgi:hypothetical protein|nr:DUF4330 domain-containing protein [Bacillota bacterium]NLL60702.1 DUF4330 domain-containing protein [Tissierellia bacterium]
MKRKFNWIDYCIILFIIAVIAVLGLKIKNIRSVDLTGNNEAVKTKKDVILVIEDVRQYSVDALQLGDNVYSDDTNYYFGKIKNIEVEDSYLPLIKNDGEGVLVRSPEKYNIILTVECNVLDRPNGVFAEGITEIKVNSTGKYKTIGLLFSAITKGIQE